MASILALISNVQYNARYVLNYAIYEFSKKLATFSSMPVSHLDAHGRSILVFGCLGRLSAVNYVTIHAT